MGFPMGRQYLTDGAREHEGPQQLFQQTSFRTLTSPLGFSSKAWMRVPPADSLTTPKCSTCSHECMHSAGGLVLHDSNPLMLVLYEPRA